MTKYWKIGFTVGGGRDIWDEFVEHNVAAIGWGWELGDLTNYRDQLRMYEKWRKSKCGSRKAFYQLWIFYNEIHPKDKLVAYGKGEVRGCGIVIDNYKHMPDQDFPHAKPVDWDVPFEPIPSSKLPKKLKLKLERPITILPLTRDEFRKIENLVKKSETRIDSMQYAPTNELGVIFLFGRYLKKLGFNKIKKFVGRVFPDAIAMNGKGKPVKIEFELYSSGAKTHEKDYGRRGFKKRCDLIVCWEDDWEKEFGEKCPIKVLELKSKIG